MDHNLGGGGGGDDWARPGRRAPGGGRRAGSRCGRSSPARRGEGWPAPCCVVAFVAPPANPARPPAAPAAAVVAAEYVAHHIGQATWPRAGGCEAAGQAGRPPVPAGPSRSPTVAWAWASARGRRSLGSQGRDLVARRPGGASPAASRRPGRNVSRRPRRGIARTSPRAGAGTPGRGMARATSSLPRSTTL